MSKPTHKASRICAGPIEQISLVNVVLPTRADISIRKRCVSHSTDHQAILLQRLGLEILTRLEFADV
jgi:hypothetical protein